MTDPATAPLPRRNDPAPARLPPPARDPRSGAPPATVGLPTPADPRRAPPPTSPLAAWIEALPPDYYLG